MSEVRRVLLANGQYIEIVQETGTSTGAVMSQNAVTTALNGKANTTHTHTASDITSGTFGSARIADGAITKAKLADDVINSLPASSYETVIVTASSDYYTVNGLLVSINGVQYTFNSTGKVYAMVPYGQVYSVTPVSTDAMQASGGGTYTASTGNRSVAVSYTLIGYGTYIEDKQGKLYTTDDWSSGNNANANSVVLLSDAHRFRIALQGAPSKMAMNPNDTDRWGNYLSGTTDSTVAETDYNGAYNTQQILNLQASTDYAAGWCNAYTFPDGVTKGYLPALGELYLAYQNKDAINAALEKCGGVKFETYGYYWSSTFYSIYSAYGEFWYLYWGSGLVSENYMDRNNNVRAFGAH